MIVKVLDPKGLRLDVAKGDEIEIPKGPFLDAALRFKQVEEVKEKTETKAEKAAREKAEADAAAADAEDKKKK